MILLIYPTNSFLLFTKTWTPLLSFKLERYVTASTKLQYPLCLLGRADGSRRLLSIRALPWRLSHLTITPGLIVHFSVDNLSCILNDVTIDGYSATIFSSTRSVERFNNLVERLTIVNFFLIVFFKADFSRSLDSEDVCEFVGAILQL